MVVVGLNAMFHPLTGPRFKLTTHIVSALMILDIQVARLHLSSKLLIMGPILALAFPTIGIVIVAIILYSFRHHLRYPAL